MPCISQRRSRSFCESHRKAGVATLDDEAGRLWNIRAMEIEYAMCRYRDVMLLDDIFIRYSAGA